jgi:hypothetical protein
MKKIKASKKLNSAFRTALKHIRDTVALEIRNSKQKVNVWLLENERINEFTEKYSDGQWNGDIYSGNDKIRISDFKDIDIDENFQSGIKFALKCLGSKFPDMEVYYVYYDKTVYLFIGKEEDLLKKLKDAQKAFLKTKKVAEVMIS